MIAVSFDDAVTVQVMMTGITRDFASILNDFLAADANGYGANANDGNLYNNGSSQQSLVVYNVGDIITQEIDFDALTIEFFKNNVSMGVPFAITAGTYYYAWSGQNTTATVNLAATAFPYAIKTGYSTWDGSQSG